jgi:hypothetical protein
MFLHEFTRFYNLLRTVKSRSNVEVILDFKYCEIHNEHCAMQVIDNNKVVTNFTKRFAGYVRSLAEKHARNSHYPLYGLANFLLHATDKNRVGSCRLVLEYCGSGPTLVRAFAEVPGRVVLLYLAGYTTGLGNQDGWDLPTQVAQAQQEMLYKLCFAKTPSNTPEMFEGYKVPGFIPNASDSYVCDVSHVLSAQGVCRSIGQDQCFIRLIKETKTLPSIVGFAQILDRLPTNLMLYNLEADLARCNRVLCCVSDTGILYVAFVDAQKEIEYILPTTPSVFGY